MKDKSSTAIEIRKALDAATPGPWTDYTVGNRTCICTADGEKVILKSSKDSYLEVSKADAHLIANAPTWLRTLLEENERLRQELHEEERSFAALEYANIDNLKELEQVRRDAKLQAELFEIEKAAYVEQISRFRSQLAEKNYVLDWYADDSNYKLGNQNILGERARSILSRYKEAVTSEK